MVQSCAPDAGLGRSFLREFSMGGTCRRQVFMDPNPRFLGPPPNLLNFVSSFYWLKILIYLIQYIFVYVFAYIYIYILVLLGFCVEFDFLFLSGGPKSWVDLRKGPRPA